jgi:DNA-binding response OmpR family regulator
MAKILVVEDELHVSSFIKKGFEEEGHIVDTAYDGAMGTRLINSGMYDVVVLDVILPQMNGLEVCQKIRKEMGNTTPIIMLTALSNTDDVIKGLDAGADDYLAKPFRFRELLARVNTHLRRKSKKDISGVYQFSDLKLDINTTTVTRSDKNIKLTSKEFWLLAFFMANPGKVLSRTTILENVWDNNIDITTNIVEVYVNYLRNKIDRGFPTKLIHNITGMGYILKEE